MAGETRELQLEYHLMEQLTQRFLKLEAGQDRHQERLEAQSATLARIEQNTSGMTGLLARVRSLEKWRNRIGGALALMGLLGAAILRMLPATVAWFKDK